MILTKTGLRPDSFVSWKWPEYNSINDVHPVLASFSLLWGKNAWKKINLKEKRPIWLHFWDFSLGNLVLLFLSHGKVVQRREDGCWSTTLLISYVSSWGLGYSLFLPSRSNLLKLLSSSDGRPSDDGSISGLIWMWSKPSLPSFVRSPHLHTNIASLGTKISTHESLCGISYLQLWQEWILRCFWSREKSWS